MKINNVVKRAPKLPQPGKVYGARVGGMRVTAKGVTMEWEIYSHKVRAKRRRKAKKSVQPRTLSKYAGGKA